MGRRQRQGNDKRSQNKKPPLGVENPNPEMPLWEKEFCKKVGLMEWNVFLRKKENTKNKYKVIEWEDIAGKEAFNNAKNRFWSEKYNIPYDDIPLPDPDLYIDHIDWDSTLMDDHHIEDLDSISVYEVEEDAQVLFGDPFEPETYQSIQPTGWEDDRPAFTASYGDLLGPDN